MKKSEIQEITREVQAVERGEIAPARVREVTILPGDTMRRVELNPESYRRKQARAWKAKTEAAIIRHDLDPTQQEFIGESSSAAKTLLAVARQHPVAIRDALAGSPDNHPSVRWWSMNRPPGRIDSLGLEN